jgi:Protein of unknown function (DUF3489)
MNASKSELPTTPSSEPASHPDTDKRSRAAAGTSGKRRKKTAASAPRPGTQTAKILRLLKRPNGASLAELTKATGWQPHSVRGFLSGVLKRKMRLKVTTAKREDSQRAYRLVS